MSQRELKGLTSDGAAPKLTLTRLRSGKRMDPPVTSDSNTHEDGAEGPEVQELRQKLTMAAEELETVRAELTRQLHETQKTAEASKEEIEEQRQQLQRLSEEAGQRSKVIEELEDVIEQQKEQWAAEIEAVKLQMELERLRQLDEVRRQMEEVRCQGDKERERFREEQERNVVTLEELKKELAEERARHVRDAGVTGGMGELPFESVSGSGDGDSSTGGAGAATVSAERRSHTASRRVTFAAEAGSPGGHSDGGGDSPDRNSTRPAPITSLASTATTVDPSQSDTGEDGAGGGSPALGDSHASGSGGEMPGANQGSTVNTNPASGEEGLMQQLTQLVQTQTDMVRAQTRAMSAQSLPPVTHFDGEDCQAYEDSFEKWIEQFEEHCKLAGWSEEHQRYHLKMSLDKTAFQTYKLLPDDVKASYSATIEALKKRFKPVDIEELRGMDFHGLMQTKQSVEQLGLELQKLAKRAFPTITGKEFDRLLKGRFFQALLPRWQRKLGAPKTEESFDELFARARTMERREEQYSAVAGDRSDSQSKNKKVEKQSTQPAKESREPVSSEPRRQGQGIQCRACHRFGHIAKFCKFKQKKSAEAPGKSKESNSHAVTSVNELTSAELEQELSKRRLEGEQELLDASLKSSVQVVTGAIGPSYWIEVLVEGVAVSAMVDTGSQSTIVSRSLLHQVFKHMEREKKPLPKLEYPSTKLRGKGGHPIDVTAQIKFTFSVDGRSIVTPVFVQPDSEQNCLLGSNVLSAIGITVMRANGEPLTASPIDNPSSEPEIAHVNLVQAATIPGMKGCYVRAQIDTEHYKGQELLFEPAHDKLEPLGVTALESLVSVDSEGLAIIPIQNYQGVCVQLDPGMEIGAVRRCELPDEVEMDAELVSESAEANCAHVKASKSDTQRYRKLLEALNLPACKLSAEDMGKLEALLLDFSDVFALNDSELGRTSIVRHSIDTGEHKPIKQQPYRTPIVRRGTIKRMVDEMKKQGIVQPSRSPWASPVVLVPKKDGSLRFCVDFRRLNSITRKDVYPLPRVDDIFDTLNGARYFTSLDLASGYWQVELDEDARQKSAFTTYNGLYEFIRMPFGLCNAPATFQRVMQAVLAGLEWRSCFVYLDDILIASRTFDEHLEHIKEVLQRLRAAGLRLKPKKCLFLREEVPYLGHVISASGIKPDPSKTAEVKAFPVPNNVTAVRQFIGLASYYRRFVPSFASIAAPLRALTKKNAIFNWTPECQTAFDHLKDLLVTAPVLAYPRFGPDAEFTLETDASGVGLGAVLSQKQEDDQLHPIAYASRALDPNERNYAITELETLAVVWAARKFRPYLLGHHTTVLTDHSACVSVLTSARPSGKLARWALTIQELNLTLKHRAGKLNANADALSRNPAVHSCKCVGDACVYKSDVRNMCVCKGDACKESTSDFGSDNHVGIDNCFVCPSVPSDVPGSSDDFCNHRPGVCSDAGVASAGMKCAGVDNIFANSENVDVVACTVKSDSVDYVARPECECNDAIVCECNDVAVCSVEVEEIDPKVTESQDEIRKLQGRDDDLVHYVKYLECGSLPSGDQSARKVVLESKNFELIDGILHHEDPACPGRWCLVVPKELRSQLLEEAHAGLFAGHFSERKVYNKIRRLYWWPGLRRDVRQFCRSCLNCVSRRGPGHQHRPPLNPIPVKGPFHRVAVDVLQLPLTSSGNKYVVVFMDYLTKWVEAFPTADQQASTIASLLVEHIICRHGVPEELLSDRGSNFLSDLILELCSLLGIRKINTSGYHPQTDGLVEKFNSTLQGMISKASDKNPTEWDKQLPLLLFAYRSVVQESTKESPFFLLYGRDPRLPTGTVLGQSRTTYLCDAEDYRTELFINLTKAQQLALESIKQAQEKQRTFYDRQSSSSPHYRVGDRVMVFMPSETTGKDRKLARPYHGPYRVVSLTATNAEVQLIENPKESSIFVALDRLRKCYPEQSNATWTGRKRKSTKRSSKSVQPKTSERPSDRVRTVGPVTRSMTRK